MRNFNYLFLIVLLVLVGVGVYKIFQPFLIAIFMAFVLSQLFKGWYQKILSVFKSPSISSFTTSVLIFLIIFLPLIIIAKLTISELMDAYKTISSLNFQETILDLKSQGLSFLKNYSYTQTDLMNFLQNIDVNSLVKNIGNHTITIIKYLYKGISQLIFTLFITFFCLYYFFKDNDRLLNKIYQLSPLKNSSEKKLLKNFVNISRATLRGSLIIAAIQGFLTTILFVFTGIPSAVILGVLATVLALIPMVGTAVVWAPVGIMSLIFGDIWQGITILLIGSLVIGSIDNVLRPKLVGNHTSLHPLLIFLSTIGGITLFGIIGFLLGPVIVVLFLNLLEVYHQEFKSDLKKYNQE